MRLLSFIFAPSLACVAALLACGGGIRTDGGSADSGPPPPAPDDGASPGSSDSANSAYSADSGAYDAPSCPLQPWGPTAPVQNQGDCLRHLVGSWAFCGGGNQDGPLSQFWNGAQGIQFTQSSDTSVSYALLRADGQGNLTPSTNTADLGSFDYDYGPDAESYDIDAGGIACMYDWHGDTTAQGEFFEAYVFQNGLLYVYDPSGSDFEFLPLGP